MTGEIEDRIGQHYQRGALEQAIADALAASGVSAEQLTAAEFEEQFGAKPGMHLLDIGSGLGGASRYFASERSCRVLGIDLTGEYARVAEAVAGRVGLSGSVSYQSRTWSAACSVQPRSSAVSS